MAPGSVTKDCIASTWEGGRRVSDKDLMKHTHFSLVVPRAHSATTEQHYHNPKSIIHIDLLL